MSTRTVLHIIAGFAILCASRAFSQQPTGAPSIDDLEKQLQTKKLQGKNPHTKVTVACSARDESLDPVSQVAGRTYALHFDETTQGSGNAGVCVWRTVYTKRLTFNKRVTNSNELNGTIVSRSSTSTEGTGNCQRPYKGMLEGNIRIFTDPRSSKLSYESITTNSVCESGECRDTYGPTDTEIGKQYTADVQVSDGGRRLFLIYPEYHRLYTCVTGDN